MSLPTSTPIVLMIHQSADMYGSDKVLLLLVREFLAQGQFKPVVMLPLDGPLKACLDELGVETFVGEVGKIQRADLSWDRLLGLAGRFMQARRDLQTFANGRQIAVVHSNTLAVLGGALWGRSLASCHVWHIHEILRSPKLVSRLLPWLASRRADAVICNSTQTAQWMLQHQPDMVARTHVVFNGLPPMPGLPDAGARALFRARIGAQEGDVVVSLVGRISRLKGQKVLIEAARLLLSEGRIGKVRFVIMGSAAPGQESLPDQLQAQVREAGLQNDVSFLPFDADVTQVWSGSDVAVMPSVEPESFGMVAIEAMAAGLPVLASDDGGLRDVVVHEQTGLLLPVGDAQALADGVARLALDPALRTRWGQAGQQRQLAKFSAACQALEIASVYTLAMGRAGR